MSCQIVVYNSISASLNIRKLKKLRKSLKFIYIMDEIKYVNCLNADTSDIKVKASVEGNLIKFDEIYVKEEPYDNDNVISDNNLNIQENSTFLKLDENDLYEKVTCKSEVTVESQKIIDLASNIKNEPYIVKQYCENCNEQYDNYCVKCSMLSHILDNSIGKNDIDRTRKTLPKYILDIRSGDHKEGIFALRTIPKGVYFGPFDGLEAVRQTVGCTWKLKYGKFVSVGNENNINWMYYVNFAKRLDNRNLIILQCDGNLYYRTDRVIDAGEELLIYHDGEIKLTNGTEQYYHPVVQKEMNDVYACSFCCLGFSAKHYLVKHKFDCPFALNENITEEGIIQCPYCRFYLDRKEYLDFHMNYCHERHAKLFGIGSKIVKVDLLVIHEKYKCRKCKYETDLLRNFNRHTISHMKVFTCPLCGKKVWKRAYVKRHLLSHTQDNTKYRKLSKYEGSTKKVGCFNGRDVIRKFACKVCGKPFKNRQILKNHQLVHLQTYSFTCSECDYKSNYKENLDLHIRNKHIGGDKRFKCSKCKYQTNYKISLQAHNYTHGETKPFECKLCRKRFSFNSSLNKHYCTAMGEKSFQCATCNRKYSNRRNLIRHIQFEHVENATKKYKCPKCTYETNYKSNLNNHVITHDEAKPFECEICGKTFGQRAKLKTHSYTHRYGKSFECKVCGKKFKRKAHLTRHDIVHSDEKPFECDVCSKKFARKQTLKQHGSVHVKKRNMM